jgi:hypothetical protein
MSLANELLLFAGIYAIALMVTVHLHKRDVRESPEKARRYAALPWPYEAMCYLVVVPLFSAVRLPGSFIFAVVAFLCVEGLCVRWYRKNGFL